MVPLIELSKGYDAIHNFFSVDLSVPNKKRNFECYPKSAPIDEVCGPMSHGWPCAQGMSAKKNSYGRSKA